MSETQRYQPYPEEIQAAEEQMMPEDWKSTEAREKQQKEFEERTKTGFEKLKELFVSGDDSKERRIKTRDFLADAMYLEVVPNDYAETGEAIVLSSVVFNRLEKMKELSEINRKARSGKCQSIWPDMLLSDFQPSVLEIAGKEGAFSEWPLHNTWHSIGFKTIYESDIDVEPGKQEIDWHEKGFDLYRRKLDALNPAGTLKGQQFDIIHSVGFFGQPTVYLSREQGKSRQEIENEVVGNLDKNLRPGGVFVFGTRENFVLDQERLESLGYEVITFPLNNKYLVARKNGIHEGDQKEKSEK